MKRNGLQSTVLAICVMYAFAYLFFTFKDLMNPLILIFLSFTVPLLFLFILFIIKVTDHPID
ncbi:MAG: hypothetical protein P8H59_10500 [Flavobacteriales bacterium]|nr:hypothetical protein [Flavobacteriales bacterium]